MNFKTKQENLIYAYPYITLPEEAAKTALDKFDKIWGEKYPNIATS